MTQRIGRRMSKSEKATLSKTIKEAREKYFDENEAEKKRPWDEAHAELRDVLDRGLGRGGHPEYLAAKKKNDEAYADWMEWFEENYPAGIAAARKEARKKALGNKKRNRARQAARTEVFDIAGVAAAKAAAKTPKVPVMAAWFYPGALVLTKEGDLALIQGFYPGDPTWCKILVDGGQRAVSNASLRPVDEHDE